MADDPTAAAGLEHLANSLERVDESRSAAEFLQYANAAPVVMEAIDFGFTDLGISELLCEIFLQGRRHDSSAPKFRVEVPSVVNSHAAAIWSVDASDAARDSSVNPNRSMRKPAAMIRAEQSRSVLLDGIQIAKRILLRSHERMRLDSEYRVYVLRHSRENLDLHSK